MGGLSVQVNPHITPVMGGLSVLVGGAGDRFRLRWTWHYVVASPLSRSKECTMKSEKSQYWESVYSGRDHRLFRWYQPVPELSLKLMQQSATDVDAPVIDIGGGASLLVDELHDLGYNDLTITDLSTGALTITQDRSATDQIL